MIIPSIKFTITEPQSCIFHAEFENQRDLVHSMMRIQEFYEGVDDTIRNNYFTLEEFMHHFTDENGVFNYATMWSGFNVPGSTVDEWYRIFSSQTQGLTEKEKQLILELFQIKSVNKPWYLIATAKRIDSPGIINHEIAHARYHLNKEYRNACDALINQIDPFELEYMQQCLIDIGYSPLVVNDEIQAYLSTSKKPDLKHFFGKLSKHVMDLVEHFRKNFKSKDITEVSVNV